MQLNLSYINQPHNLNSANPHLNKVHLIYTLNKIRPAHILNKIPNT